jgi:bacterioferritin-associated ferredoxin
MYICLCNAVTEGQLRECAQGGACSFDDLAAALGVGSGCGRCRDCAAQVLAEVQQSEAIIAA